MPLRRREFLKNSAVLAAAAALDLPHVLASEAHTPLPTDSTRDYYELRSYRIKGGEEPLALHAYLEHAFMPALAARGIRAIGVFTEPDAKDGAAVWVLIPHRSLASIAAIATLDAAADAEPAADAYRHAATHQHPGFERMDSWLLLAFAGLPQLAVPSLTREKHARVFELRTYESYSEAKALNKIEMFNSGEIELMQQLGMSPVFYGQAMVGRDLPHLTYMLCFPDRATAAKNWAAFGRHPVWVKLKETAHFADNVSKVTSRFLAPTPYSQL